MVNKAKLIVCNTDSFLLLQRMDNPDKYSLLGGNLKRSETPLDAVLREAREEGNVQLGKDEIRPVLISIDHKGKKSKVIHYFLTNKSIAYELKETNKFLDLVWIEKRQALNLVSKRDRLVLAYFAEDGEFFNFQPKLL